MFAAQHPSIHTRADHGFSTDQDTLTATTIRAFPKQPNPKPGPCYPTGSYHSDSDGAGTARGCSAAAGGGGATVQGGSVGASCSGAAAVGAGATGGRSSDGGLGREGWRGQSLGGWLRRQGAGGDGAAAAGRGAAGCGPGGVHPASPGPWALWAGNPWLPHVPHRLPAAAPRAPRRPPKRPSTTSAWLWPPSASMRRLMAVDALAYALQVQVASFDVGTRPASPSSLAAAGSGPLPGLCGSL